MDIYKLNRTKTQADVFSFLCMRAGEKMSQRDIAKALKISPTAVANSLGVLKKSNLVSIEQTKTINFISLNRDERRTIALKRVENLKAIYMSGLLSYLEEELPGATIVLFGSYSYGYDTEESDIDIAIIGRKEKRLNLEKFRELLWREVRLNFYDSWKDIHQHLRNNILNGIILSGSVAL